MRNDARLWVGLVAVVVSAGLAPGAEAQVIPPPQAEPVAAIAEEAAPAEDWGDASATPQERPRRADVRPRWGMQLGAFGGVEQLSDSGRCARDLGDAGDHCEWRGPAEAAGDYGLGGPLISLELGVQSDWLAGFLLVRTMFGMGRAALLHFTLGLVAEVTLFDLLQVGIGASLDPMHIWVTNNIAQEARLAPGLEVRLGLASGGGPYERRGFVVTSFFHLTIAGPHTLLLGGLEIGFQTF